MINLLPGETRFVDERFPLPATQTSMEIRREVSAEFDPNPANNAAVVVVSAPRP